MFWLGAVVSLCYVPGLTGAYIATQWPVLAVLLSFGLLCRGPFTVFHAAGLLFVVLRCGAIAFQPGSVRERIWALADYHHGAVRVVRDNLDKRARFVRWTGCGRVGIVAGGYFSVLRLGISGYGIAAPAGFVC